MRSSFPPGAAAGVTSVSGFLKVRWSEDEEMFPQLQFVQNCGKSLRSHEVYFTLRRVSLEPDDGN